MKRIVCLSALLPFVFAGSLFAAPNMQEGKWEMTTSINVEGVPFAMPAMKTTECITKKDIQDGTKTRPASSKKNDCEIKDLVETSASATWKTVCKDGTRGTGEASYQGGVYSATLKMVGKDGSGASTTTIKAKRVGDCK